MQDLFNKLQPYEKTVNYKWKSRRRFFLLMRSRTPPISSEFRGGLNTPNPPLGTPLLSVIYDRRCIISSTSSWYPVTSWQQSRNFLITLPIDVICSHYTLQFVLLNGLALVMSEALRKITVSCGPLSWPSLTAASCKVIAVIFMLRCTMKSFSFCEGDGFLIKTPWAQDRLKGS